MNKSEMWIIGLFGLGGVALILYQHSLHSGQIVAAIGGAQAGTPAAPYMPPQSYPASLGGTPTPGQENLQAPAPAVANLVSGPGWSVH